MNSRWARATIFIIGWVAAYTTLYCWGPGGYQGFEGFIGGLLFPIGLLIYIFIADKLVRRIRSPYRKFATVLLMPFIIQTAFGIITLAVFFLFIKQ